jgi:DNA-binding transcriptional MerR regulator
MTMTRTIQRASAETGLSTDTLRYYERIGILPSIGRSESGHRRFTDDDMGWIKLVQCLRATGMPLEDLHRYAELVQEGEHTAAERLEILLAHKSRIDAEMAELTLAMTLVDQKISGYTALVARDSLAPPEHRPGPRRVRPRTAG